MLTTRRIGLSLVELTLVLMIFGAIAAIGVPRLSAAHRVAILRNGAHRLASDLRFARQTAISKGHDVTVTFNTVRHTYSSNDCSDPRRRTQTMSIDLSEELDQQILLNPKGQLTNSITFDLEGVPYVGVTPITSAWILIGDSKSRFRVLIESQTGFVSVENEVVHRSFSS